MTIEQILEAIENMKVLELNELVKAAEEKFGVSASAPVMVAGGRVPRGEPLHLLVVQAARIADVRPVGLDEGHRNQVGQAGQLLLAVGDQRAELAQDVKRAAQQQAAGGVHAAGEALAHGDEVRRKPVLPKQEQPLVPRAGLDLVAQDRRVAPAAEAVGGLKIRFLQPDGPVVHHDDLMAEARGLVGRGVPRLDGLPEALRVVDGHGNHAIDACVLHFAGKFGPQAAQGLGHDGGAVVVARQPAGLIRHDQKHGDAPRVAPTIFFCPNSRLRL